MKVRHLLLLSLFVCFFSCKKDTMGYKNTNSTSSVEVTPAKANITAYMVVIKASTDTLQTDTVKIE